MTRRWMSKDETARDGEGIHAPSYIPTKAEQRTTIIQRKRARRRRAIKDAAAFLPALLWWGIMIYCFVTIVSQITEFTTRVSNYLHSQGF